MAYVPPHKRLSKDSPSPKPTPVPSSIIPKFHQTLTLGSGGRREQLNKSDPRRRHDRQSSSSSSNQGGGGGKIIWAANAIRRWFAAGSAAGDDRILSNARLTPFDCEFFERRNGAKPLVIEGGEGGGEAEERPWVRIAEKIVPDLVGLSRFLAAAEGLELEGEVVKLNFVARMGKVLFLGNSVDLESIMKAADAEPDSRKPVSKSFYTNVSPAYMEQIRHSVIPNNGFDFDTEKEHYLVKVIDKSRPESTILCKCKVVNDAGALEIYKIELDQVRHLVVDISCLYKDLDLRLALLTKRILKSLHNEENECLNKLVKSAIVDPSVKGGLRWPLGKESVADRFSVVGVWHTKYDAFKSQTTRVKLRHADRFDHRTSTGEVSSEVTLKLTGISKYLRDASVEEDHIMGMVQEEVKLIWHHFLCYNHFST